MVSALELGHESDTVSRRVHKKKAAQTTNNQVIPLPAFCPINYFSPATAKRTATSSFLRLYPKMQYPLALQECKPSYLESFHPQKAGK
jgi:hypothetical protein